MSKKIEGCKNNPENSPTTKVSEHIPWAFSMSIISSFRSIETKHGIWRGKDCMKKFLNQKEHALKIINFKKKKMGLLITKQQESYEDAKICDICKEKIENKYLENII